jgi:hypothetical protein
MKSVMVFVKRSGILVGCRNYPVPDGCFWRCAHCEAIIMRASFGVMNGLYRCTCGSDVELLVDGQAIEIEALDSSTNQEGELIPHPNPAPAPQRVSDEDFLRECGIAMEDDKCSTPES